MSHPLLQGLNTEQCQATAAIFGPVLVLAGAGSGKTKVLTSKIAYMIDQGVQPEHILAVTFTNKAAKEMKARVEAILPSARSSWIGTFHSVSSKLLRRDIDQYTAPTGRSWGQNFVIYDESDSIAAVKAAVQQHNLDEKMYVPKALRYQISELKNSLLDAHQYAHSVNKTDYKAEKLALVYDSYEAIMSKHNALDFDDLLMLTVKLLQQQPAVLSRYHQHFQHILVDEFQDTNNAQYELVRLLAEGSVTRAPELHNQLWQTRSLTVVGDVDQSIYSWRGANFRILLNFQKDFPAVQMVKLQKNYRSKATILEAANSVIENNSERLPKTLEATRGEGEKLYCYEAKDDRDEAFFVVDRFQQLINQHNYKPSDCCILYRTNAQSRSLEDVLMSRGIPYTMVGGLKFYERREIKDLLAYLTILFNPQDDYSLKRIINVPKRGVGKTSLDKLEQLAAQHRCSLFDLLQHVEFYSGVVSAKFAKTLLAFGATLQNLRQHADQHPADELLVQVAEATGYLEELRNDDPKDAEGRLANVEEFVSVAKQFHKDNPEDGLPEFLAQMSLLSDLDSADAVDSKLTLMTLHAAKGLEFPVVALCGLEEGIFPHFRSLNSTDQMEEERRLMYVGLTRAEDCLMLTYARRRMIFGDIRYQRPSRFLMEIPPRLIAGDYSLDAEGGRNQMSTSVEPFETFGGAGIKLQPMGGSASSGPAKLNPAGGASRPSAGGNSGKLHATGPGGSVYKKGDRVRHGKFGEGTVIQVFGEGPKTLYNVQFDSIEGKKLINPKFAPLEVV
jgi:DNA helicase II / ATP-dependent DNA helicase PcrA